MNRFKKYGYFKPLEQIVDSIISRTGNSDRSFYRNLVNFYICQAASNMRVRVVSKGYGKIPVNFYAISLATSGYSKGFSSNIIIDEVMSDFRIEFTETTYPFISDYWLEKLATKISNKKGSDYDVELESVTKEFKNLGYFLFSFDSGTLAGVKQLRQKLLMGKIGALSFIADEIGSNILEAGVADIINGFLELFDMGKMGDKLLLSSKERKRIRQMYGNTPANMLLFGTPSKLFDGGAAEAKFRTLLTTGLSRRCFYAYSIETKKDFSKTPEEAYAELLDVGKRNVLKSYLSVFKGLADSVNYEAEIEMKHDVGVMLTAYKRTCEQNAQEFSEIEDEKKAELSHSYFKVMKLAGAYAFMDNSDVVTKAHLGAAIRCGIDSSKIFQEKIINQPKQHERLLSYLCSKSSPSTYADMARDLPFFPKAQNARNEIFTLAASQGYISNITLKHTIDNDIDLYTAEELTKTDLECITLSYSEKISRDYENISVDFNQLHKLTQSDGYHWLNHHLYDGKCSEAEVEPGFNIIVLDMDYGVDVDTAKIVLSDYYYHMYTTKRHSKEEQRFRVVIPMSHIVKLGAKEYTRFMRNVFAWLPFDVDEQTSQRSRKWLTNDGEYCYNEGNMLLDAHQFIPHTNKAIALNETNTKIGNSPQLEKWFIREIQEGDEGRNNILTRYAFVLVDSGMNQSNTINKVLSLNSKLPNPLAEIEIHSTISLSVAKKITKRDLGDKDPT